MLLQKVFMNWKRKEFEWISSAFILNKTIKIEVRICLGNQFFELIDWNHKRINSKKKWEGTEELLDF